MATMMVVGGGSASAACTWNYTGQTMTTSSTPVFNSICGTPSWGDEDDFVRIRANAGAPVSSGGFANYSNTLTNACVDGARFDVISYVHNDAEPQYNAGAGTGIARNVAMTNNSPIGNNASSFNFSSRITASNAASVFDTASLNCGGAPVTLRLVPNSAMMSRQLSGTWSPLTDSVADGTMPISSDPANPGDVPGCWEYRVLVAYTVEIDRPTTVTASGVCNLLTVTAAPNRTVRVSGLNYSASNATVNGVNINWGDGSNNNYPTVAAARAASHQYSSDGTYSVTARITFTANGQTFTSGGAACTKQVTYSNGGGTVTTTTSLPNVGPGSTIAIVATVIAAGAVAHRYFLGRRLSRQ
jgi:hypothetical protein